MPDENPVVGTSAPAATPAPAAPAAPAVVAPAPAPAAVPAIAAPVVAPVASEPTEDPPWLKARLERARAAVLNDLGVKDADEAKTAVAAAKAAADAKKSAEQRAVELAAERDAIKTQAERQAAYVKELSGRMLMALAPEQQKAVTDFAGDDPEKQYLAIKHFGPTWAAAEQAKEAAAKLAADAAAAEAAAKAAAAATPGNTSAAPAAPSSETPSASPADPKSVYTTTRAKNPFAAAAYGLSNPTVYDSK